MSWIAQKFVVAGMWNDDANDRSRYAYSVKLLHDAYESAWRLTKVLKDMNKQHLFDAVGIPRPWESLEVMPHVRLAEHIDIYIAGKLFGPAAKIEFHLEELC